MNLVISTDDFARFEEASRALLSPLAAPDVDAWRQESMRAVCGLFGAEAATFGHPTQPAYFAGYGMAPDALDAVSDYLVPAWSGTGESHDPLVNVFHEALRFLRIEAWDFDVVDGVLFGHAREAEYYHAVMVPERLVDTQALFVPSATGTAMLEVHALRRGVSSGYYLPLLRTLLPAFKAGLDALARFEAHRQALDAIGEPVAAFDADGRELHRNAALTRLLADEPERDRVTFELLTLARRLRGLAFPRRGEAPAGPAAEPPQRAVQTARGRYVLRGAILPPGAFGSEASAMVSVQAETVPAPPTAAEVRARHGLTRREAEVALLVAEGLKNDEIAGRLFVSPHTARHHVEGVLAKLGVGSRAAVAARLLQPA